MRLKLISGPAQVVDAVEAVCSLSFLYNHTIRLSLWKKETHFISVLNQHSTILSPRLTCPEMLLLLQAKLRHLFFFHSLLSPIWAGLWTWNSQVQNGPHFRPDCNCNRRATYHFKHFPPECGDAMRYTVINPVSHHRKVSP